MVASRVAASDPDQPTITDSVGLTWNEIRDTTFSGGNPRIRIRCWYAVVGSSPASMTVTGDCANGEATGVWAGYITGADTDYSNQASVTNGAGDPSPTLGVTPDASSTVIGIAAMTGASAITEPTDYTQLSEFNGGSSPILRTNICYDAGSAGTGGTFTSANRRALAFLIEIKEAAGAATVTLDTGAVAVAGSDLLDNLLHVLETAAITVADADLFANSMVTLDTGAIAVAGTDIAANQSVLVDAHCPHRIEPSRQWPRHFARVFGSGPRHCVVTASGTIETMRPIFVRNGQLSIWGQTSPGGVQIKVANRPVDGRTSLVFQNTDEVIIRHIRIRPQWDRSNPAIQEAEPRLPHFRERRSGDG